MVKNGPELSGPWLDIADYFLMNLILVLLNDSTKK
jgi:hypothetical protein